MAIDPLINNKVIMKLTTGTNRRGCIFFCISDEMHTAFFAITHAISTGNAFLVINLTDFVISGNGIYRTGTVADVASGATGSGRQYGCTRYFGDPTKDQPDRTNRLAKWSVHEVG